MICQKAHNEHYNEVPKIPPAQTTQAKSKVIKPASTWRQDVQHRRSVSLQASSSKQRPDESEQSEGEFWEQRETRAASDRFGKRPRTKVHHESPERFVSYPEKKAKEQLKKEKTRKEQREEADKNEDNHQNQ